MFGLAAVPSIGLLVGMWRLPASPRWLISKSRVEEAKQVLRRVRSNSDVSAEIADIQESVATQSNGGIKALFRPSLRMPLLVGVGLAMFQQITGINTVIYYSPTIFKFAGIDAAGPAILAGAGLAMVMWCMHVLAIFLLDRIGRRPLLLIGVAGQIVGLGILGVAFHFPQLEYFKSYIAIGGLVIYVACFALVSGRSSGCSFPRFTPCRCADGHGRGNSDELGNEPGRRRDLSYVGRSLGAGGDFLVVWHNSHRRLGLFLLFSARNQEQEPGTNRGALAGRPASPRPGFIVRRVTKWSCAVANLGGARLAFGRSYPSVSVAWSAAASLLSLVWLCNWPMAARRSRLGWLASSRS